MQSPGRLDKHTRGLTVFSEEELKKTILPHHAKRILELGSQAIAKTHQLTAFPDADLIRCMNEQETESGGQ